MTSQRVERTWIRTGGYGRFRGEWVKEQIESGDIYGVEWIDKDLGIFKIIWVRVDNPEFKLETHAELFKRWAQRNIAQATSQIPRHGRRGFAVLCKRCRISWKLDIWKDLNRTEFLSLSQNRKVRSKYL